MKKILTVVLCIVFAVGSLGVFAACHTHTYDESSWKTNALYHWRAATCEHTDAVNRVAHSYDSSHTCTVCGYQNTSFKAHTFSTEWTADETHHWHAATCDHVTVVNDKAKHTFDDKNKCTVCNYQGDMTLGGVMNVAKWNAAVENLRNINNFTVDDVKQMDGEVTHKFTQFMLNKSQQIDGETEIYRIYTEESVTEYVNGESVTVKPADSGLFNKRLNEYIEANFSSVISFLLDKFSSFTYNEKSQSYVWKTSAEENMSMETTVQFIGDSIFSVKMTMVNGDFNYTFHLYNIGTTNFEIGGVTN